MSIRCMGEQNRGHLYCVINELQIMYMHVRIALTSSSFLLMYHKSPTKLAYIHTYIHVDHQWNDVQYVSKIPV